MSADEIELPVDFTVVCLEQFRDGIERNDQRQQAVRAVTGTKEHWQNYDQQCGKELHDTVEPQIVSRVPPEQAADADDLRGDERDDRVAARVLLHQQRH